MNTDRDLFKPVRMGDIELANRVVMAPLTRSRAGSSGVPGPMNAEYYRQRATAGLIVAEATQISRQGQGYAFTPGIVERHRLVYVHCIEGATQGPREVAGGFDLQVLRRAFSGLFVGNNGYDGALAEEAVRDGRVDLVAFGRPFIGNPDLVARLRLGKPLVDADKSTWYGGGAHGYTDYPGLEIARAA